MNLEALSCNKCGAPIDVPTTSDYVSCAHCGSRLVVRRTPTAHFTEVLEHLTQHAGHVDHEQEMLKLQNALLRLDQDWEVQRRHLYIKGRDGGLVEPTSDRVFWSGVAAGSLVLLGVVLVFVNSSGGTPFFVIFMGGLCALLAHSEYVKYQRYQAAAEAYRQRRNQLWSGIAPQRRTQLPVRNRK